MVASIFSPKNKYSLSFPYINHQTKFQFGGIFVHLCPNYMSLWLFSRKGHELEDHTLFGWQRHGFPGFPENSLKLF
jgi:hypothetical protein